MKTLISTEFKRNFKSWLLWTSIVGGLAGLMLFLFPAFEDAFSKIEDLLSVYPPEFLEAFGIGEDGLDMSDIYGWYGVEGYLFVTLIGGSYAAIIGSSILSKEEDDHTVEFLLAQPISRTRVLFGKVVVIALYLLMMNIVLSIVLLVAFSVFGELRPLVWLLYSFAPMLLQMVFASIALLISIFVTKSRKVMSIALGLSLGMYVVDLISKLTEEAEFLKYVTPYEYINATTIVNEQKIDGLYLLLSFAIITLSLLLTWRLYLKKDMAT